MARMSAAKRVAANTRTRNANAKKWNLRQKPIRSRTMRVPGVGTVPIVGRGVRATKSGVAGSGGSCK